MIQASGEVASAHAEVEQSQAIIRTQADASKFVCPLTKDPLRCVEISTAQGTHHMATQIYGIQTRHHKWKRDSASVTALQISRFDESKSELVSDSIGAAFPVIDGVPILIARRGRVLDN